jgi:hypothetical protein
MKKKFELVANHRALLAIGKTKDTPSSTMDQGIVHLPVVACAA